MNLVKDSDSEGGLCCDQCHYKFTSQLEYSLHCVAHQNDPVVSLVKLSDLTFGKLKEKSYKVNTGVARRSRNLVSPLRISLKKQEGSVQFEVVKAKRNSSRDKPCTEVKPKESSVYLESDEMSSPTKAAIMGNRHAEGSELYGRPASTGTAKRKSNTQSAQNLGTDQSDDCQTKKKYSRKGSNARQTAACGKSTGKKKSSALNLGPSNEDLNLSEIGIRYPGVMEGASNFRQISVTESEIEKLKKTTILEKLNDLGFALVPCGTDAEERPAANDRAINETSEQTNMLRGIDMEIFARPKNPAEDESNSNRNRNPESNPFNIMHILNERPRIDNWPGLEKKQSKAVGVALDIEQRIVVPQDNCTPVLKKRVRRNYRQRARGIQVDMGGGGSGPGDPDYFLDTNPNVFIQSACEYEFGYPGNGYNRLRNFRPRSPGSDNRGPRFSRPTCTVTRPDQQFNRFDDPGNSHPIQRSDSSMLLGPEPEGEDSRNLIFDDINRGNEFRPQPFVEETENDDVEVLEDEVPESPSPHPSEHSSFEEIRQENPTPCDGASNVGASVNRGMVQSYSRDSLTRQSRIRSEESDDSHSRRNFEINAVEASTPMEHLSQQVHRLQGNSPMNFMPHMQPQENYPGLPSLGPHQAGSFDRLSSLQSPLLPALYQGYGIFNQNYPIQGPQQFPSRHPILQPGIPIQPRGFPHLVPHPGPRSRSTTRRSSAKTPTARETARKRRLEPAPRTIMPGSQFLCSQCTQVFATPAALESHTLTHRASGTLPFRCEKCPSSYPTAADLEQHELIFHQEQFAPPELGIPIIDLNYPGVRDQLARCGVNAYMPLSQLESNSFGYFGIPVAEIDATSDMAVSNFNMPGATHVLVLGKMKPLSHPQPQPQPR